MDGNTEVSKYLLVHDGTPYVNMAILPYNYFGEKMITKVDYRKILIKEICDKCPYYDVCGLDEDYDCEAFKRLVKIYEMLDSGNPDN